ncbi:zinc finger protein 704-like [Ciona intestinalis]
MTGVGGIVEIHISEHSKVKEQPESITSAVTKAGEQSNMSEEKLVLCGNRPVSASIEVPKPCRMRKTSEEPTMTELMAAMVLSNLSTSPVFHNPPNKDMSPQSFGSSGVGSWSLDPNQSSPSRHLTLSRNAPPSGSNLLDRRPSYSTDDPTDPNSMILIQEPSEDNSDEPQDLRVNRPQQSQGVQIVQTSPDRLEVVMEEEEQKSRSEDRVPILQQHQLSFPYYFAPTLVPAYPASLPAELRVQLASTPPHQTRSPDMGCGTVAPGYIESTKFHRHLHRSAPYHKNSDELSVPIPSGGSSPSTLTLGSAPTGFYHFPTNPIPVASLAFSPSHRTKLRSPLASSSPAPKVQPRISHSNPITIPSGYTMVQDGNIAATSITLPQAKAFSWHSSATGAIYSTKPSLVHQRQQLHQAASPKMAYPISPKSLPHGRKVRGDGKKCRKVYGMENREMWCTACKWKKACQRFPD